jgi:CRISPR/Cas system-associated exonuclease Cas4 (RecB family)
VQSPLFRRIQSARRVESELPFRLEVDRMAVEGFIDKVLLEDDGAVVIDFKTNRVATPEQIADAAGHYLLQMQIYALAVQERFGLPVTDAILYFLTPDVTFSCRAQLDADGLRAELAALDVRLRSATDWTEFPPAAAHCPHCPYQTFCRI